MNVQNFQYIISIVKKSTKQNLKIFVYEEAKWYKNLFTLFLLIVY